MDSQPENSVSQLLAAGLDLIPLRHQTKVPRDRAWRLRVYTQEELETWLQRGGNIGARIRPDQLVLDYDPRNDFQGDSLERFAAAVGLDLAACPTTRTPSGGSHLFLRVPPGLRFRNTLPDFPGVELKGHGRQVVAPPSVHPLHLSGPLYLRDAERPDYAAAPEAPAALIELAAHSPAKARIGSEDVSPEYLEQLLGRLEVTDFQEHEKWLELMMAAHAATDGCEDAREVFVAWSTSDPSYTGHDELIRSRWDSLEANEPGGITGATLFFYVSQRGPIPPRPVDPEADFGDLDLEVDMAPPAEAGKTPAEWAVFERDRQGKPIGSYGNAYRAVQALDLRPAMDLWSDRIVLLGDLSSVQMRWPGFGEVWNDTGIAVVRHLVMERFHLELSLDRVHEAVVAVAAERAFNPLTTWLRGLRWDGVSRIDSWLTDWAYVEDSVYTRAVGRRVILGAVARALAPGTKFDTVLVLEGKQGIGKSTLVRTLGGKDYTCEGLPAAAAIGEKDVVDAIRTSWFVELDELDSLKRAELTALKSFISRQQDKARLAYARVTAVYPRRCILVGTTNDAEYLTDDTGNRRWWPVRLTRHANLERAAAERDQLFAEAVHIWLQNPTAEALVLPPELRGVAAEEQEARREDDPWQARVVELLESKYQGHEAISTVRVLEDLGISPARQTRSESMRLCRVFHRLGFEKIQVGPAKARVRAWKLPG